MQSLKAWLGKTECRLRSQQVTKRGLQVRIVQIWLHVAGWEFAGLGIAKSELLNNNNFLIPKHKAVERNIRLFFVQPEPVGQGLYGKTEVQSNGPLVLKVLLISISQSRSAISLDVMLAI